MARFAGGINSRLGAHKAGKRPSGHGFYIW